MADNVIRPGLKDCDLDHVGGWRHQTGANDQATRTKSAGGGRRWPGRQSGLPEFNRTRIL